MTVADQAQPSTWEQRATAWIIGAVLVLALIGFALSFVKVAEMVEPSFGAWALLVPIGIDIGIAVLTALDLLMTRWKMRTRWLRLIPWGLVAVTVVINVAGEPSLPLQAAHAVMPVLWVVSVEAGAHALRVWIGLHEPDDRHMDRIRVSRWLLAPFSTVRLWRRMVLWEIKSYPEALRLLQDRLLARCDLQDNHGGPVRWRWRAPRRERVLYKLGQLAPEHALPRDPDDEWPDVEASGSGTVLGPPLNHGLEPTPIMAPPPPAPPAPSSNGDVLSAAVKVAAELRAEGRQVSQRQLGPRLRADGYKLNNALLSELVKQVT